MKKFCVALLVGALGTPASSMDVVLAPADSVVTVAARSRGNYEVVVPTVLVRAGQGEQLRDVTVTIALLRGGREIEARRLSGADLAGDTGGLTEAGVPGFVNAQLLHPGGLSGLFGQPTTFAKAATVESGQALGTFGNAFITRGPADQLRISVAATGAAGGRMTAEETIAVAEHKSPIEYRAPVRGTWLMTAMPGLRSHHRLNPPSEFAVDFFRANADGKIWHDDSTQAANFYGFGADVLAVADGVVVAVTDGEVQDRAALIRRPDEAPDAAGRRIQRYNMTRYAKDFARAAAGNLVVLRHEKDGKTEYSAYGHLRAGISVKPGQLVKQGDVIGQVGDTGDSAAAHLHFQVNAGPDPFTSKSLPVRFTGVQDPTGIDDVMEAVTAK
jgi:hypothetical protein